MTKLKPRHRELSDCGNLVTIVALRITPEAARPDPPTLAVGGDMPCACAHRHHLRRHPDDDRDRHPPAADAR